jgi:hypothetical protein
MIQYRKFSDDEIKKICSNMIILIDSREKSDYVLKWCSHKNRCETKVMKLDQGDYSFMVKAVPELGITEDLYFDRKIVIERKNSLDELSQNFTKNRSRFEEELAMFKGKMDIVISDSWDALFMGRYSSNYNRQAFIGTLQSFKHRYNVNFQFMSDEAFPVFVYTNFYYYLRSLLKGE